MTFIKCAVYQDRPSQADNLHIDIWYKGENLLFDAGTYKYNTDERTIKYFFGTEGHNTVMLGSYDQMQKGPRFIWWNWTSKAVASISESDKYFEFKGSIKAFESIGKNIYHSRTIKKYKDQTRWEVKDSFTDIKGQQMRQIWHILPGKEQVVKLKSTSIEERTISSWYSSYYGIKVPAFQIEFLEVNQQIETVLEITN